VLRDKKGEISSILHSGNDITDRKNAEIALLKSAEKIKRFAYFVSHDLKNPAISLIGLTRCLTRRYENVIDEKGKKFCQQIMTKSEQINLLVENINCFVATTELPLCVENFDLKEACCAIKEEFCDRLLSREICFTACNSFPIIRADKLSLIRILRNLIDNSLKYGGHALNTIEIGYMDGRDTHVISVRDNGKGFEEKERKKIFAAFTRNTTSEEAYGTGLGLAIVKELAERHGGSAWAELNRGRGVTFYISISKNLT
jgi:light-regulated signal transduction histidine kinase (bacteriophytochrome)